MPSKAFFQDVPDIIDDVVRNYGPKFAVSSRTYHHLHIQVTDFGSAGHYVHELGCYACRSTFWQDLDETRDA